MNPDPVTPHDDAQRGGGPGADRLPPTPGYSRTGIFISHAHRDAELARLVYEFLESALGIDPDLITCTSDEEHSLLSGEALRNQLSTRLDSAAVLILLSTRNSQNKDWVEFECGYATGQDVPLHVLLPGEVHRDTIPEPYRDLVTVTLSNGEQVLALTKQLRQQFPSASEPRGATPAALARLAHAAHNEEIEYYRGALEAERQRSAESLKSQRRRSVAALVATVFAAVAFTGYLLRDFDNKLKTLNDGWEERLSEATLKSNENRANEVRRFALRGNVNVAGIPARNVKIEVYRSVNEQTPVAVDNTDDDGDFSFEEGELPIDPREKVDFVVRPADGTRRTKKVSPLDASLSITFKQ